MTTPDLQIYLARNDQQAGPYTLQQVNDMLATQQILLTDLAWHKGMTEWKVLGELTQGQLYYQPQNVPVNTANPPFGPFSTTTHTQSNTSHQPNKQVSTAKQEVKIASRGKRIVAKVIDLALFFLPQTIVSLMYFPREDLEKLGQTISREEQIQMIQGLAERIPNNVEYGLLAYLILLLFVQHQMIASVGQSIGKKLLKLQIVDVENNQLVGSLRGFMLRSFSLIIMSQLIGVFNLLIVIFILDFLLFFSKHGRTLHDRISKTKVIDLSK